MKSFNSFRQEYLDDVQIDEANKPTSPEKWARAKAAAKSKFAVYPSAYANAWASKKYKAMGGGWRATSEEVEIEENHIAVAMGKELDDEGSMVLGQIEQLERGVAMIRSYVGKDYEKQLPAWVQSKITLATDYIDTVGNYLSNKNEKVSEEVELDETAAWQRKEGKRESGGLNQKGVDSYRREHPGSKLKTAVTTKPSKLKPGSKAANRRKSFCARMSGMKKRLTSAKTANDPDSRINKSLRKWNC